LLLHLCWLLLIGSCCYLFFLSIEVQAYFIFASSFSWTLVNNPRRPVLIAAATPATAIVVVGLLPSTMLQLLTVLPLLLFADCGAFLLIIYYLFYCYQKRNIWSCYCFPLMVHILLLVHILCSSSILSTAATISGTTENWP